ncbi:MAG: alpha/beta fold hydrolase [Psychroflexus sp.]|jgi:pimeloyl-ACP methyl ester carboxylesterase|nr:alpha/beta fold hydrolase [Psychroflexus sp.]
MRKKIITKLLGLWLNLVYLFSSKKAINLLYKLFVKPRKGKLKEEDLTEFLINAQKETIQVGSNHIMLYRWKNSGPRILLVHGWESNAKRWEETVNRLSSKGYEIMALDAPAHGLSKGEVLHVPLYAECINKIQEKYPASIAIGHSAGGMSLIYHNYAYTNSPSFEKLIILGAPSEMTEIINDMAKTLAIRKSFIKDLDLFFKNKFGFYFHEFSIAKFAGQIEAKTLVIHDKYDRIISYSSAKAISKNLKNGRLKSTKGLGHSLNRSKIITHYIDFITNE